jgi:hypothetical protein
MSCFALWGCCMNQVNLFLLALVSVYGFFGMWAFVVHEFPVEGPKPTAHARLIVDKLLLWFVLVPLLLGLLYIVLR